MISLSDVHYPYPNYNINVATISKFIQRDKSIYRVVRVLKIIVAG
jgi:hypothetical protein